MAGALQPCLLKRFAEYSRQAGPCDRRTAGVEEEHRRRPVRGPSTAQALDERRTLLTDVPMRAINKPQRRISGAGTVALGDDQRQSDQWIARDIEVRHDRNLREL